MAEHIVCLQQRVKHLDQIIDSCPHTSFVLETDDWDTPDELRSRHDFVIGPEYTSQVIIKVTEDKNHLGVFLQLKKNETQSNFYGVKVHWGFSLLVNGHQQADHPFLASTFGGDMGPDFTFMKGVPQVSSFLGRAVSYR
jgi:hypothetical protein